MKYLFLILICLSGCSGMRVTVDKGSCEDRGIIDGIVIQKCKMLDIR